MSERVELWGGPLDGLKVDAKGQVNLVVTYRGEKSRYEVVDGRAVFPGHG